jgi:hypothetical protein
MLVEPVSQGLRGRDLVSTLTGYGRRPFWAGNVIAIIIGLQPHSSPSSLGFGRSRALLKAVNQG